MSKTKMRTYLTSVTIKLSCNLGVQVKQQNLRLKINTLDSSVAADRAKNMALYAPYIRNRHNEILSMYVVAIDEKRNYEYTECVAQRIDDEIFEVEVTSYPINGLAYCALVDDFFTNAELLCKERKDCEKCPKSNRTCIL